MVINTNEANAQLTLGGGLKIGQKNNFSGVQPGTLAVFSTGKNMGLCGWDGKDHDGQHAGSKDEISDWVPLSDGARALGLCGGA